MSFPPPPESVRWISRCPACRVEWGWVQVRATPAKEPQPVCPEAGADE